ncbi:MAG: methionyl-tRNA formyltransferase [bacterium]|nr:methionyl-tRNA formyltransferase [bacterium]
MNIAYFGSPKLSELLLTQLIDTYHFSISLVVTQPDKPAGKHLALTPTPVKLLANGHAIDVYDRESFDVLPTILEKNHVDLCIVFAYGRIIPASLLALPTHGFWNIHPSLLPKFRGPAPIIYPLILGAKQTGITLMRMDQGLDTGDIILQEVISITDADNRESIENKLIPLSAKLIANAVSSLENGTIQYTVQSHKEATQTRLLKKSDGYIAPQLLRAALEGNMTPPDLIPEVLKEYGNTYKADVTKQQVLASIIINHLYKGLHPWPGLWTSINKEGSQLRVKLLELHMSENVLILDKLQVEGKQPVDFATFSKAYSIN